MSYWKKRQAQLNKTLEENESELKKRLSSFYAAEEEKLNRQIASYYANYGKDNVIEYRQLLLSLSESDKRLLMQNMDEFAEKYPQYEHLLPVRESIYRLNRLEGMQYSIQMQQLEMGIKEEAEVKKHLSSIASMSYDAVVKTTGPVGVERADIIKTVVGADWTKKGNFSKRIWNNRSKLTQVLKTDVAAGFARGDDYRTLTQDIRRKFQVGRNEAYRLIYTEGTYVMNESKARVFETLFEYYSVSTVGDSHVCGRCSEVQDETIEHPVKISERIPGLNFPPFHPWCRCTYQIVVPDQQEWVEEYVMKHGGDPDLTDEQRKRAAQLLDDLG